MSRIIKQTAVWTTPLASVVLAYAWQHGSHLVALIFKLRRIHVTICTCGLAGNTRRDQDRAILRMKRRVLCRRIKKRSAAHRNAKPQTSEAEAWPIYAAAPWMSYAGGKSAVTCGRNTTSEWGQALRAEHLYARCDGWCANDFLYSSGRAVQWDK